MWAATAFHPDGYFTAVIRPPTPHAKSGRVNINAAQASPAARYCEERSRTAMTAAAPATAYAGIANATHFWPSRRIPSPGTSVMSQVVSVNPGPVASRAGIITAATAMPSNPRALRARHNTAAPTATTISSTTENTSANKVVREAGTADAFHMPPNEARLPRVPSPGSARAANAWTPAASPAGTAAPSPDATSHGIAASTEIASTPTLDRRSVAAASPTISANTVPVGVSPATAIQNASGHQAPRLVAVRSRMTVSAIHGRQP
ncbi:Uncharacterised protein [Mycobacteroides abscessus subsp. abscessus]|nr:Uncharacterised protein [Mycobacteroides abscessus subsp. abscessus]SKV82973.1 Uncharacterised protein [Mycobacteroides abscessus subsp. massiliense]SHU17769.1 Uncharacterised protein [Mycobacteroides abscessus subsp. abscessus]SHU33816.1 Uncharacterised protein [Mycobacteroides abscessus subsp. abscessus]SHU49760.1 Uncharacterised protein [Mycobacteroides abscessus subsp. abscessus]